MSERGKRGADLVAVAGPNGAGKSTVGPALLRDTLGITRFVNADVIAQGLSAFEPEAVAFEAGRIMLQRMRELAEERETFAFETTLSGRTYAPWVEGLVGSGYRFHLLFLWLPSSDFAVQRVRDRVAFGGHHVPEETIRRRFRSGLRNFFQLYRPLCDTWRLYDNSAGVDPRLVAFGQGSRVAEVRAPATWEEIRGMAENED